MRVGIRDIDKDLWREARIQALREGVTMSKWINAAIREKLERTKTQVILNHRRLNK